MVCATGQVSISTTANQKTDLINTGPPYPGRRYDRVISRMILVRKLVLKMLVVNPIPAPTFAAFLHDTISSTDFTLPPPTAINSPIRHDPFATLPYDVAHALLLLLPAHTVLSLCTASYPLHSFFGPSNRLFWRAALSACTPWFWELHNLIRGGTLDLQTTEYKGLFLWVDNHTRPRKGLRGPFMGVANRRRIWGVCEQLAAEYRPRVALKAAERVQGVMASAESVNVDMPAVVWPKPKETTRTRTATAQWVYDRMGYLSGGVFEAFWDEGASLVGIAFTVPGGSDRRVFGKAQGTANDTAGIRSEIAGLVLHMPDIFIEEKMETSIKGITASI